MRKLQSRNVANIVPSHLFIPSFLSSGFVMLIAQSIQWLNHGLERREICFSARQGDTMLLSTTSKSACGHLRHFSGRQCACDVKLTTQRAVVYTSTSPYVFIARCWIKQRHNFSYCQFPFFPFILPLFITTTLSRHYFMVISSSFFCFTSCPSSRHSSQLLSSVHKFMFHSSAPIPHFPLLSYIHYFLRIFLLTLVRDISALRNICEKDKFIWRLKSCVMRASEEK